MGSSVLPCCRGQLLITFLAQIHEMFCFLSESEPPLSYQPKELSDAGLVSLLRQELGMSSADLFSMTVTDYDIKPKVRECLNFLSIWMSSVCISGIFSQV